MDAAGQVHVVLPVRAPAPAAADAVAELDGWIRRRRQAVAQARTEWAPAPGLAPFLGQWLPILLEPGSGRAQRKGQAIVLSSDDPRGALEAFYRRAARAEVATRLQAACERAGTNYSRLSIRGQKTRWASCSAGGAMSFNWKLMMAPAPVLDYVVEHEVCHLEIRDHSPRFWALVQERCPDYRTQSDWLRRYGPLLSLDGIFESIL